MCVLDPFSFRPRVYERRDQWGTFALCTPMFATTAIVFIAFHKFLGKAQLAFPFSIHCN